MQNLWVESRLDRLEAILSKATRAKGFREKKKFQEGGDCIRSREIILFKGSPSGPRSTVQKMPDDKKQLGLYKVSVHAVKIHAPTASHLTPTIQIGKK